MEGEEASSCGVGEAVDPKALTLQRDQAPSFSHPGRKRES